MQPHVGGAVGVPEEALVTPEQAESALGHVQATEMDAKLFDDIDVDHKEKEIALLEADIESLKIGVPPVSSKEFQTPPEATLLGLLSWRLQAHFLVERPLPALT